MTRHLFRSRRGRDLAALQDPTLAPLRDALTAEPSAGELAGERDALAAFRAVSWGRHVAPPRRRALWRPAVLSSVLTTALATKVGAAAAAGTVALSGAAAAAYTGNLPDGLQDVAHKTIKAPAAKKGPPAQAVGPDATGPAAWGLCQAFAKDKAEQQKADKEPGAASPGYGRGEANGKGSGNAVKEDKGVKGDKGKAKERSVAYRNLVRAAGGEDEVEAYCAAVPRPSDEPEAGSSKAPKASKAPRAPTPAASQTPRSSRPTTPAPVPSVTTSAAASPTPTATGTP